MVGNVNWGWLQLSTSTLSTLSTICTEVETVETVEIGLMSTR